MKTFEHARPRTRERLSLSRKARRLLPLYLMMVPGIAIILLYKYLPMYGLIMAFENFSLTRGFFRSEWIGLKNFRDFFASPFFPMVMKNTIFISFGKILLGFPIPIILALMINEVRNRAYMRTVQTVIYLPHFISWVVLGNLAYIFLNQSDGVLAQLVGSATGSMPNWLGSMSAFPWVLILTDIWKECGWGTIIYMAALTTTNPELYEASAIDGAGKLRQILSITIPCIFPTILTMFMLRLSSVMSAGFEQILIMQNTAVYQVSEVIDTYSYSRGFLKGNYGLGAAIGLFQSIVSLVLVTVVNRLSRKTEQGGLW